MTLLLSTASAAWGRGNGIGAYGCGGCHRDTGADVTLTHEGTLTPGQETVFTVRITRQNIHSGGIYIPQPSSGSFRTLTGEGLAQVALGLSHSRPKSASNGAVTFRFGYTPPSTPDGVTLEVYAVAANGNGNASGDAAAELIGDWVFGCQPQTFYRDADGDGYGWDSDTIVRCSGAPPMGYAVVGGDCDDFRAEVHPGAVEKCNKRDDNCNGLIDEDSEPIELWPDNDGDGYYARKEGEPVLGCVPTPGYAADPGDCDDDNPDVHPGAEEICNYIDDNCNGRVDERVRPRCGVGFCERESYTCNPEDCYPGEPSAERCSGLDESCNGLVDEGILCDAGQTCVTGECLSNEHLEFDRQPGDSTPPGAAPTAPSQTRGCSWGVGTWGAAGGSGVSAVLGMLLLLGWRRRR